MTNEEKAKEIANTRTLKMIEPLNLSKEQRQQIEFNMYYACIDMAEWKEQQMTEKAFECIAEWFYEHPHSQMVCSDEFETVDKLIDRFEKAMEGGNE